MQAAAIKQVSPQDYLSFERGAKEKHEYFEGQVIAMAGASLAHNRIVSNLVTKIGSFLDDKSGEILPSDIRISVPAFESYMYPDATIVCGKPEMEDEQFDTLKNPTVIFEVLSPSTEDYDRGKKFFFYRQIPSLKEFIVIDSTKYFIEISRKQEEGSWKFEEVTDLNSEMYIATVDCRLSLQEIYKSVFAG